MLDEFKVANAEALGQRLHVAVALRMTYACMSTSFGEQGDQRSRLRNRQDHTEWSDRHSAPTPSEFRSRSAHPVGLTTLKSIWRLLRCSYRRPTNNELHCTCRLRTVQRPLTSICTRSIATAGTYTNSTAASARHKARSPRNHSVSYPSAASCRTSLRQRHALCRVFRILLQRRHCIRDVEHKLVIPTLVLTHLRLADVHRRHLPRTQKVQQRAPAAQTGSPPSAACDTSPARGSTAHPDRSRHTR